MQCCTLKPSVQAISEVIQVSIKDVFLQGVWCQKFNTLHSTVQWESPLQRGV